MQVYTINEDRETYNTNTHAGEFCNLDFNGVFSFPRNDIDCMVFDCNDSPTGDTLVFLRLEMMQYHLSVMNQRGQRLVLDLSLLVPLAHLNDQVE